jgi:hypothetical protein
MLCPCANNAGQALVPQSILLFDPALSSGLSTKSQGEVTADPFKAGVATPYPAKLSSAPFQRFTG